MSSKRDVVYTIKSVDVSGGACDRGKIHEFYDRQLQLDGAEDDQLDAESSNETDSYQG